MVDTNVGTGLEGRLNSPKISLKTGLLALSLVGLGLHGLSRNGIPTFNMYEPPSAEYRIENPDSGLPAGYVLPQTYRPFE